MNLKPFISKPHTYQSNVQDGEGLNAGPAWLSSPAGRLEPGVIVRWGHIIKFVIPAADAIRLANELNDAVEAIEQEAAA